MNKDEDVTLLQNADLSQKQEHCKNKKNNKNF